MYDILIIGCGVSGASCAYMLSKYDLKVAVVDKSNDVANGTTKANSAIIHAGYDPAPGTLMARLNVRGTELAKEIAANLDVPCINCGSLVLAFDEADLEHVKKLYDRGCKNNVPGLEILDAQQLHEMEPEISDEAVGALYAPSSCIINPWEYCLAMAETAVVNGTELFLNTEVTAIDYVGGGVEGGDGDHGNGDGSAGDDGHFVVETSNGTFEAKHVISATGVYSDAVRRFIEEPTYQIVPTRGQYFLLDKDEGKRVTHTVFQCPNEKGKGVLVSPTVDGNLIVGPDANLSDYEDTSTDKPGLDAIKAAAQKSVPGINFRMNIKNFAGVRANSDHDDFVVERSEKYPGFIDIACIKSPGLTAAPAIGEYVVEMLAEDGLELTEKAQFVNTRKRPRIGGEWRTAKSCEAAGQAEEEPLSANERNKLIEENPLYGRIICRCETISEGEIVAALHAPIPPTTLNGVKRRVGSGMGRCQGGFCTPKIHEIISRELGIDMLDICLEEPGSEILKYKSKDNEEYSNTEE